MTLIKEWTYEEDETSTGIQYAVYNQDGTRITEPYIAENSARLIAAAPESLKALQLLTEAVEMDLQLFDGQPEKGSRLRIAKDAISKATAA